MGLDMYLTAERGMYEHKELEESIKKILKPEERAFKISEIILELGYWRKANAIHNWFVENCQDGVDECQKTFITKDQLQKLLDVCKEVQKNHDKAQELLPSVSGFFFGNTDYDEYYFICIDNTIQILENVMKIDNSWFIHYHSSW